MLKTISAALLAVSVLAAPALAASSGKTDTAPATKTMTDKAAAAKTPAAIKPNVLNANAGMHKHHVQHAQHHRHHKMVDRYHKKVAVGKVKSKVSYKPAVSTTKRG